MNERKKDVKENRMQTLQTVDLIGSKLPDRRRNDIKKELQC
jgi:hypothetical protein